MTWADAIPNFLIGLREGLEAGIVVSILLAAVHRSTTDEGRTPSAAPIWIGVAGAVAVAGSFAAVLTFSTSVLSTKVQEAIGGILSVTAVALVTGMVFWMRRAARSLSSELRGQVGVALAVGAGALALTAFAAVGREGLETTLFLWTAVKASGETVAPLIGAALGIASAVTLCWLLYRKAIHLDLSKFFNTTAIALLVIAAGVLSYGIGSLQTAQLLPGSSWIAFDFTAHVSTTSWWTTILTGVTNLSPKMTVLQVASWAMYLGITIPAFVLAGRRTSAPAAQPAPAHHPEKRSERFAWLARRPYAVGGVTVVVPILLAAAAIVALPSASAATTTSVTVTAKTCAHEWHSAGSGAQSFTVRNTSSKVAEVNLVNPAGAIVAEIETLGPATTAAMPATLGSGTYRFRCILPGQAATESDAVTVSGSRQVAAPAVAPVTVADLEPAVKEYRAYVAPQLATLSREVATLHDDLAAGHLDRARTSWLAAQLTWERVGAAYDSFGELGDAIDGLPQGLPEGVHDPHFTGLHRIEYGLWHGQPASELTPIAAGLATNVQALRARLDEVTVDPTDMPIRAHEILEDALRDHLSAMSDFGSGTSYAMTFADVEGTREVLDVLAPLIDTRAPKLLATLDPQLDALDAALLATRVDGAWRSVADTPLAQRQRVTGTIGQALETLSNIPTLLEVPPQR